MLLACLDSELTDDIPITAAAGTSLESTSDTEIRNLAAAFSVRDLTILLLSLREREGNIKNSLHTLTIMTQSMFLRLIYAIQS